jgi:catechol 2,3-dioxygenase-like lactoylglutathione lyase family enzyme
MVGIVVRDMAAALKFYRSLGLDIPPDLDGEPHVEITANGYRIAWDTEELMRSINPDWIAPTGQRIALAFKCDSPQEVDSVYARLVAQGYHGHKQPWDAFWGQRYAVIADPDGSTVDLFAAL